MKNYFVSQWKRARRLLPGLLLICALLFVCLGAVFSATGEEVPESKFRIGLVGTVGDSYLELGIAAMQMMDSTRLSMELVTMEEAEAADALAKGDITAYVVVPENFVSTALSGTMLPLSFVSNTDAANFTTFIKEEITGMISDIVLSSQKGSYGISNALKDAGYVHIAGKEAGNASIEYVKFILNRGKVYKATSLGIASDLSLGNYLLCGLSVLVFLLCSLPFAPYVIGRDHSLAQILWAKGCSPTRQILCQWGVYFLCMLIPAELLLLILQSQGANSATIFLTALPAFFALSALSFFLFLLARDYMGGVLLNFFGTLALCFVSGCMYPVYFFPVALQKVSAYLPTGLARTQLSGCLTGKTEFLPGLLLILYGIVFLTLSVLLTRKRLRGGHQ
ncbi:MAG: ABC transporter permease [Ruminococcaceae bacterium]|nr:ABC transporter permease [Oscillospiraceae bacterium]